jgi:hypothetical protein
VLPIVGSILVSVGVKLGVRLLATAVKHAVDSAASGERASPGAPGFPELLNGHASVLPAAAARVEALTVPAAPAEAASRLAFDRGIVQLAQHVQSRRLIQAYRHGGSVRA